MTVYGHRLIKNGLLVCGLLIGWLTPMGATARMIEVSEGCHLDVPEDPPSPEISQALAQLTPAELETLDHRRTWILRQAAEKILALRQRISPSRWRLRRTRPSISPCEVARQDRRVLAALKSIDNLLKENAQRLTSCHRVGFCAGLTVGFAVGVSKYAVGFAHTQSIEGTYDFDTEEWHQWHVIENERTQRAHTPSLIAHAGLRLMLYFSDSNENLEEVNFTYLPSIPATMHAPGLKGFGIVVSLAGPPVAASVASFTNKSRRRYRALESSAAPSCEAVLKAN